MFDYVARGLNLPEDLQYKHKEEEAIVLRPKMDSHHSTIVWLAKSMKIASRTNLKSMLRPDWVLKRLHQWSGSPRRDRNRVLCQVISKGITKDEVRYRNLKEEQPTNDPVVEVVVGGALPPAPTSRHNCCCCCCCYYYCDCSIMATDRYRYIYCGVRKRVIIESINISYMHSSTGSMDRVMDRRTDRRGWVYVYLLHH